MTKREACLTRITDEVSSLDNHDAERILDEVLDELRATNPAIRFELDRMEASGTYPWAAWWGMIDFIANGDVAKD